ncbi:MAG: PadR family transcriptional regulator, partial [Lactobacillus helsingborgensis]|nr:PadR family transcriptional regulator [Lactobacillus helsingborgensis]
MAIQIPTRLLDGAVLAFLKQDDLYGYALTQN